MINQYVKNFPRGFTLIELLVVVAIIGLLSSVVLASLNSARAETRDSVRKAELKQMQIGISMHYQDYGFYPSTSGQWWGEPPGYGEHSLSGSNGFIPNVAPAYMPILPHDPNTEKVNPVGGHIACRTSTDHNSYLYKSDRNGFKLIAHCIPESTVGIGQPFYDPSRPTWAWMICSEGAACNW